MENTDPKCYWLTNYLETLLVEARARSLRMAAARADVPTRSPTLLSPYRCGTR